MSNETSNDQNRPIWERNLLDAIASVEGHGGDIMNQVAKVLDSRREWVAAHAASTVAIERATAAVNTFLDAVQDVLPDDAPAIVGTAFWGRSSKASALQTTIRDAVTALRERTVKDVAKVSERAERTERERVGRAPWAPDVAPCFWQAGTWPEEPEPEKPGFERWPGTVTRCQDKERAGVGASPAAGCIFVDGHAGEHYTDRGALWSGASSTEVCGALVRLNPRYVCVYPKGHDTEHRYVGLGSYVGNAAYTVYGAPFEKGDRS